MNKKELIKYLKKEFYNDYCVLIDSTIFGLKAHIYGDKKTAVQEHKQIISNCNLLKPCTVELINLWGGN